MKKSILFTMIPILMSVSCGSFIDDKKVSFEKYKESILNAEKKNMPFKYAKISRYYEKQTAFHFGCLHIDTLYYEWLSESSEYFDWRLLKIETTYSSLGNNQEGISGVANPYPHYWKPSLDSWDDSEKEGNYYLTKNGFKQTLENDNLDYTYTYNEYGLIASWSLNHHDFYTDSLERPTYYYYSIYNIEVVYE